MTSKEGLILRRQSYYSSSYRRRRRSPLQFILKLLLAAACIAAVVLIVLFFRRAVTATGEIEELKAQNTALQQEVDALNELVPEATRAAQLEGTTIAYQELYPDMKVSEMQPFAEDREKTVYLTFDDGPSNNTTAVLDALAASNAKATFFVIGKNIAGREDILKRIVAEGHTLGVHTYSHDYPAVYSSVESFLDDFHQTYQAIYQATGVYPTVFRFPGGSINAYNRDVYQEIISEMLRRGFVYYDWNASCGDADGSARTWSQMAAQVMDGVGKNAHPVILLHDGVDKAVTAAALPTILEQLNAAGYTCAPLDNTVRPITFNYRD